MKKQVVALNALAKEAESILRDDRAKKTTDETLRAEWVGETIRPWRIKHDECRKVIDSLVDSCKVHGSKGKITQKQTDALEDLMQGQELIWQAVTEAACSTPREGRPLLSDGERDLRHASKVLR